MLTFETNARTIYKKKADQNEHSGQLLTYSFIYKPLL